MKQYCKYCANAYIHGDTLCICEEKGKLMTEKQASRPNKCNLFVLNEMSVFDYNQIYKERKEKKDDGEQTRMKIL